MANIDLKDNEYRVPEGAMDWLDKKFKRMVKVAKEVGAAPPAYKVVREEFKPHRVYNEATGNWEEHGLDKYLIITVEGSAPKLAGWSFIATLTHTKDGNLVNKVPGIEENVPEKYRTAPAWCDYCKTARRRVDSFIVRSDDGEYRQIGRNCLAKFLGYSNPERVAQYATFLADLQSEISEQEEKLFAGGGHSEYRDLLSFLTMVAAVSREKGWRTATAAKETGKMASIVEVEYQLDPHTNWHKYPNIGRKIDPTTEDESKAKAAIAFARSDKLVTDNDYKHNLKTSTASDEFHEKAAGVVASLINYHERDQEWERQRELRRAEAEKQHEKAQQSVWLGNVGDRIIATVTVTRRQVLDGGQFGPTYLFKMQDKQGNVVTWFASNDALAESRWYDITGTIKKLDEYKGVKQTVVTRCKAEEVDPNAPPKLPTPVVKYSVSSGSGSRAKASSTAGLGGVR